MSGNEIEPMIEETLNAIKVLFRPGQVIELRGLGHRGLTNPKRLILSGYYDNPQRLAEDAIKISNTLGVEGTYWTLQTVDPAILTRSANRFREIGAREATSDEDVKAYAWLPVDIDATRKAGISATDAEKQAAHDVLGNVVSFFRDLGISPVEADSGNGYHAIVPVSLDKANAPLIKQVLASLALRFDTD
jgi:hypothetical protein